MTSWYSASFCQVTVAFIVSVASIVTFAVGSSFAFATFATFDSPFLTFLAPIMLVPVAQGPKGPARTPGSTLNTWTQQFFWRMDENGGNLQSLCFTSPDRGPPLPGSHPFGTWIYFKTWSFGAFACLCYPQDLQKSTELCPVSQVKTSDFFFASQTTTKWIKMTIFTSSGLNIQKIWKSLVERFECA